MKRMIHSAVKRRLKIYGRSRCRAIGGVRRPIDVIYNPDWKAEFTTDAGEHVVVMEPENRFMVVQTVPIATEVDGVDGLSYTKRTPFPVLFVPQATIADMRWYKALEDSRTKGYAKKAKDVWNKKQKALRRKYMNFTEDFAKEYYDAFKRQFMDPYNMSTTGMKDPSEARKRFQDKHGRDLRSGFGRELK